MRTLAPFDIEIRWNRLINIMDEVDAAVVRTAFSSIVGESRDFGVLMMDSSGRSVAQSQMSTPAFMITLPITCKHMLAKYPPHLLRAGDVLITNDPWLGSGHLPDLSICMPVFVRGKLAGFIGCVAHISDIGGRGDYLDGKELFEEGLRIPPTFLVRGGKPGDALFDVIAANVRAPDLVIGDIHAILGAEALGAARLIEFLNDYGWESLDAFADEILTRSDAALRSAIASALPPGEYYGSADADGYGEPVHIEVRLTVGEGTVHADFTGSSDERTDASINSVLNCTFADTYYPFKCSFMPELPNNEGCTRFLSVFAPSGSILNTRYPRAVRARSKTSSHIHHAIYDALAKAVPDRVHAGSGSFWTLSATGIDDDGEPFRAHMLPNGGKGAVCGRDGLPTIAFPYNGSITPVEVFENIAPLMIEHRRLRADSGGQGLYRGGPGQSIKFVSRCSSPMKFFVRPDKVRHPPPGILGGGPGSPGELLVNGERSNASLITLGYGESVEIRLPGGGGYGSPVARQGDPLPGLDINQVDSAAVLEVSAGGEI